VFVLLSKILAHSVLIEIIVYRQWSGCVCYVAGPV